MEALEALRHLERSLVPGAVVEVVEASSARQLQVEVEVLDHPVLPPVRRGSLEGLVAVWAAVRGELARWAAFRL